MPTKSREAYLLRTYGITQAQYDSLYKKQRGRCYVCQKHQSDLKKNLCVDHNHKTGEVRGLLCLYCNRYLVGRFTDPALVRRIAKYLTKGTGWYVPKKKPRRRKRR